MSGQKNVKLGYKINMQIIEDIMEEYIFAIQLKIIYLPFNCRFNPSVNS